jgi:hypothetical protein
LEDLEPFSQMISEEKLVVLIWKIIPDQQLIHQIASWTLRAFLTDS